MIRGLIERRADWAKLVRNVMSIGNDSDWRRAFAFWLLLVAGNIALAVSIGYFMLVQITIKTQLFVFLIIGAVLLASLLLGRWKLQPLDSGDFAERWRIGPWISALIALEITCCGLLVLGHVWAIFTHYRQPPGAF